MNTLFKTVTNSANKKSVLPFQKFDDLEHIILIEDLELTMSIGIYPNEKKNKQRVLISLEISMTPKSNYDDDIKNTLSYEDIIRDIESITTDKHYNLLETFAEDIAALCFKNNLTEKVKISVKKPDVFSNAAAVGFAMTRIKD